MDHSFTITISQEQKQALTEIEQYVSAHLNGTIMKDNSIQIKIPEHMLDKFNKN